MTVAAPTNISSIIGRDFVSFVLEQFEKLPLSKEAATSVASF